MMISKKAVFTLLGVLTPLFCSSTELKPWFGIDKQIEIRPSYRYQSYRSVQTEEGSQRYSSNDNYFGLSAAISNDNSYGAEIELLAGETSQTEFGMISEMATLRYLVMNDVDASSPVSLMAGLSVAHVHRPALEDISNFYHGTYQFELHGSVGKEVECGEFWLQRYWGVLGVGIANEGSPWLRANLNGEYNFFDIHQMVVFANSLWGFGDDDLLLSVPFEGYGDIGHHSVDIGLGYRYFLCNGFGSINLDYSYRVYARNAPERVNTIIVSLFIPYNF